MNKKALVLIDIQNDYFAGGALELKGTEIALQNAQRLLKEFRNNSGLVIHIQHISTAPDKPFMRANTAGAAFHPNIAPLKNETVIQKHVPNSFWGTNLEETLQAGDISELVLCGMMTHMCVSTTARAAMERGYDTTVVADACTTMDLSFDGEVIPYQTVHKTALAEISMLVQLKNTTNIVNYS